MLRQLYFFLLFGAIFTILSCDKSVNSEGIRPSAVIMIPGVPDTSRIERGIDADSETDAIQIEWRPSPEEFVDEYDLFRSNVKKGPYSLAATVSVPDSGYLDRAVALYTRYYYFVVAVTDEGLQSPPSDTLDYKLLGKAAGLLPAGEVTGYRPVFSWEDPNIPTQANYLIRLKKSLTDSLIWLSVVPSSYSGTREEAEYNWDGLALEDSLSAGQEYIWRVDILSSEESSGSESQWVTLRIQ
jgi:hypothetical protein